MKISENVTASIDLLIDTSQSFEDRLSSADIAQAHDWMFAVREMLLDIRRIELQLAAMYDEPDLQKAPALMQKLVNTVLYEMFPHVQGHMTDVEEQLLSFMPDDDAPTDAD